MSGYSLVQFENKNLKLIFNWRNQKDIRKNSINKKKIKFDDHKSWIDKKIKIKNNKIFIFYKKKIPIGMCSLIKKKNIFFFSYLIKKKYRGKGLAKLMVNKFLKKIMKTSSKHKVYANVLVKNKISYNLLTNIGFKLKSKKKNYYILKLKS